MERLHMADWGGGGGGRRGEPRQSFDAGKVEM